MEQTIPDKSLMVEKPTKLFNRDFLLLWQGQTISYLGSQGFYIAMLFWIKHDTGSAALMGILSMLYSLPAVFLGPVAGVFADRHSRRKIIILCDFLRGVAVLSLAGFIFLRPQASQAILIAIFAIAIIVSVLDTFFGPSIIAAVPDVVPKDRIATANSLDQFVIQITQFIGQGLGGTLFRLLGAPVLFFIDGITYLYAAVSTSLIRIPQTMPEVSHDARDRFREFGRDILAGLHYVWQKKGLRELVFVQMFLAFFTAPVIILLPFFVEDVLKATTDWYGYLLAAYGVGTMLGYLVAGMLKISGKARSSLMIFFIILEAFGYGLLGIVDNIGLAIALALVGGLAGGFVGINIMTIVQVTTPGEIRGRVFGVLSTLSAGLYPIGAGLAGVIADLLDQNIPLIYLSCGIAMTILTVLVALNPDYRQYMAYQTDVDGSPEIV